MRALLVVCLVFVIAGSAPAWELGATAPVRPAAGIHAKPAFTPTSAPSARPDVAGLADGRQGGEDIASAVPIAVPGVYEGFTTGYDNDYDEMCPWTGNSPDVVYLVTPDADMELTFDLCESLFDTKIFIYDEDLNLVGCNDDAYFDDPVCHQYTSRLTAVPMAAGVAYYVVIAGYGQDHGYYRLEVTEHVPCVLECPAGAQLEGEPPLEDGYVDLHNGGCGSPDSGNPFQQITEPLFCGRGGWYLSADGFTARDTDWFHVTIPAGGLLEITGNAEVETHVFELAPQDCETVAVAQIATIGPCEEASLAISGEPGSLAWVWVGSAEFDQPDGYNEAEFDYVLLLNLDPVAVEPQTWTSVRSLFD